MRIAYIESKYGQPNKEGQIPHVFGTTEQWASLEEAVKDAEDRLRQQGLAWTTRRLGEEIVEIDVRDPPTETLLGFLDADAIEQRSGAPIEDFLRFQIEQGAFLEELAETSPKYAGQAKSLGIREVGAPSKPAEWSSDFKSIERKIRARRVVRGVLPEPNGRATRVKMWDAVLGFKGELRPAMVWDGPDGPVGPERIGVGRRGVAIRQVPRGVVFISWRILRKLVVDEGHECLVGGSLWDEEPTGVG